jgi:3-oxoacyl-[acyl-carrier-protein] synthase II
VSERVCITGVGVVSAAGVGFDALSAALRAHRACGRPRPGALPVALAATVPEPIADAPGFPDDRKAALAFTALDEACEDAGLTRPGAWPAAARRAVFLGTGLSSVTPGELAEDVYPHLTDDGAFDRAAMAADLARDRAAPDRHLPARVTAEVARRVGAAGPTGTSFSACAAAAQAIAEGAWAIRRGDVDVAIVGGHDAMVHPLGLLSFVVLGALSPTACRPFDGDRDGFMIGEGAAIFVLESESVARARGARVRAFVHGAGTSADAWNVTAPHPEGQGAERAMRRALRDAGVSADAVGYVNAHGTGTPLGDKAECAAIARVFGDRVPVSSIKGAIGHTIAAAGAVEAAACVAALEGGFLPGTVGLGRPDPTITARTLSGPADEAVDLVVSNSFGFGGQNCALVLGRAESTRA